jgi:hypothetical protein
LEPGSIFKVKGSGLSATSLFKIMVNGYNLKTLALPTFSSFRAKDGLQGVKGLRLASRTKT